MSTNNKTSLVNITTSEETCEKLAEICTYTLPRRFYMEPDYEQCQVTFHQFGQTLIQSISAKDKRVRENSGYLMANSVTVILVGTSTNLFNLIAFAYVYFA